MKEPITSIAAYERTRTKRNVPFVIFFNFLLLFVIYYDCLFTIFYAHLFLLRVYFFLFYTFSFAIRVLFGANAYFSSYNSAPLKRRRAAVSFFAQGRRFLNTKTTGGTGDDGFAAFRVVFVNIKI